MINFVDFFKNKLATPFLVLFLIVNFSLLVNIPIPFVYEFLNTSFLIFLFFFYIYIALFFYKNKQVSKLFILITIISLVPIIGVTQAMIHFDQPFIYGILAERVKVLAFGSLLIVFLLEKGLIELNQIKNSVIYFAFVFFSVLLILNIFVPAALIEDYDFVVKSASKGYRFKFDNSLVVILYFFSLAKCIQEKKFKYLILITLILFYFIFLYKARSLAFSVLITTSIYLVQKLKLYLLFSWSVILTFVLIFLIGIGYWFFPDQFTKIIELFTSAINVFIGGEITDSSAMSRVMQFDIAKEGVINHPFFGNGLISSRWEGGLRGLYGHFYPADIGWMGILYLYGIVGTLTYVIPFILTFIFAIKIRKLGKDNNTFISALIYTMLFFFVNSTTAGIFVKKVSIITFVFSLIYYYYYSLKSKEST